MGDAVPTRGFDNDGVRALLALLLVLGQVLALTPMAEAQALEERVTATWTPKSIGNRELAGTCGEGACPIQRGVTYQTSVRFNVDKAVQPLVISTSPGGLDIVATSAATGSDFTPSIPAGGGETINLSITILEATVRNERRFFLARVILGGSANVSGSLLISVTVPSARVAWGRLQDPETGAPAPLQTIVGAGQVFQRTITFTPSLDIQDFGVKANTDRVAITGVTASGQAGVTQTLNLRFTAPIVNRRTRMDVVITPVTGITPLVSSVRMRVLVLPAEIRWGPPQLRATLNAEDQRFVERTLTITSNYDIPGVQFRTQDVGLVPILEPLGTVDLRAGRPQTVRVRMCPGYAPTTYFLGITAYQASKPLNQRLQIKMEVGGDAANIPVPQAGINDPCANP